VRAEHTLVRAKAREAVEHAIRAGEALHLARTELASRPAFLGFVRGCGIDERQAFRYLRIYAYRSQLRAARFDGDSVRAAIRYLSARFPSKHDPTRGRLPARPPDDGERLGVLEDRPWDDPNSVAPEVRSGQLVREAPEAVALLLRKNRVEADPQAVLGVINEYLTWATVKFGVRYVWIGPVSGAEDR
jgi:hypothetical protein